MPPFERHVPTALLLTALLAPLLAPGVAAGQKPLDPKDPASYFAAMPVQPSDAPIRSLLDRLGAECTRIEQRCPAGVELLYTLFQGGYRDDLPDFVVQLVEEDGRLHARQPVLLFNRRNTPYLEGAEHLWVLIFSARPAPLEARLTIIQEREGNPFAGVLGLFGVSAGDATSDAVTEDRKAAIRWSPLSESRAKDSLWLGTARVPVPNGVVCRLTLLPGACPEGESCPALAFQAITGHVSNSRSSAAAFSVALGTTFDTEDTAVGAENASPHFNGYALAKFYLPGMRPRRQVAPHKRALFRRSAAIVFGTNVTNDPFEEIVLGFSLGHILGKAGLVVAGNAIEGAERSQRKWKLLVGVDFTF